MNRTFGANLAWLCETLDEATCYASAMLMQADNDDRIVELRGMVDALLTEVKDTAGRAWQINNEYAVMRSEEMAEWTT